MTEPKTEKEALEVVEMIFGKDLAEAYGSRPMGLPQEAPVRERRILSEYDPFARL